MHSQKAMMDASAEELLEKAAGCFDLAETQHRAAEEQHEVASQQHRGADQLEGNADTLEAIGHALEASCRSRSKGNAYPSDPPRRTCFHRPDASRECSAAPSCLIPLAGLHCDQFVRATNEFD